MTNQTGMPLSADYFILSLMRLDRDHYQRVEAVRSVTGDDMAHFLIALLCGVRKAVKGKVAFKAFSKTL